MLSKIKVPLPEMIVSSHFVLFMHFTGVIMISFWFNEILSVHHCGNVEVPQSVQILMISSLLISFWINKILLFKKLIFLKLWHLCFQSAVLALDSSALDIDQVENLIKFCPTKEEMETLKVIFLILVWLLVWPSQACCRIDYVIFSCSIGNVLITYCAWL